MTTIGSSRIERETVSRFRKVSGVLRADKPELGPIRVLYTTPYERLVHRTADFDTYKKEYFVTVAKRRAATVAEKDGKLLLVNQYRLLINGTCWEIPGGAVGAQESPKAAAKRECLEESGIICRNLKPLIFFHPSLDTVFNPTYVFFSKHCSGIHRMKETGEVERSAWFSKEHCLTMILEGRIQDSLSIIGLLSYFIRQPRFTNTILTAVSKKLKMHPFPLPKEFLENAIKRR